jgi:hypothetical protein
MSTFFCVVLSCTGREGPYYEPIPRPRSPKKYLKLFIISEVDSELEKARKVKQNVSLI